MRGVILMISLLVLPAASAPSASLPAGYSVSDISWSDADSGRADGIKFRIKDYDAAEKTVFTDRKTGGVARNGAQCAVEAAQGKIAWGQAEMRTAVARQIVVTANYGVDRYDRWLLDISFDGVDYGASMMADGHLQAWDYDAGDAKPLWCAP